jgi:hypothetical protein
MLAATADEENGFHGAKQVLASSTVRPAAAPRRARRVKVVASARDASIKLSGS